MYKNSILPLKYFVFERWIGLDPADPASFQNPDPSPGTT